MSFSLLQAKQQGTGGDGEEEEEDWSNPFTISRHTGYWDSSGYDVMAACVGDMRTLDSSSSSSSSSSNSSGGGGGGGGGGEYYYTTATKMGKLAVMRMVDPNVIRLHEP